LLSGSLTAANWPGCSAWVSPACRRPSRVSRRMVWSAAGCWGGPGLPAGAALLRPRGAGRIPAPPERARGGAADARGGAPAAGAPNRQAAVVHLRRLVSAACVDIRAGPTREHRPHAGAVGAAATRPAISARRPTAGVVGEVMQRRLDAALTTIGLVRRGDRYAHPRTRFYLVSDPRLYGISSGDGEGSSGGTSRWSFDQDTFPTRPRQGLGNNSPHRRELQPAASGVSSVRSTSRTFWQRWRGMAVVVPPRIGGVSREDDVRAHRLTARAATCRWAISGAAT
jgi:hypothetical protein